MSAKVFGKIADDLASVLDDAIARKGEVRLKSRVSYIKSLSEYQHEFTGYDRNKIDRACHSVERCIGARNSKNAQRIYEARADIHQVRTQHEFNKSYRKAQEESKKRK